MRGIANLIEIFVIGMKALIWSGNEAAKESEKDAKVSKNEFSSMEIFLLIFFSFGFALVFFVALPYAATHFLGIIEETKPILFNLVDGLIKIIIFFVYLISISYLKDIRRVFQYHGAEHMAVHCYESGLALNVKNVKKFQTMHPRCGTAFLLIVLIVSILIFALIPSILMQIFPGFINLNFFARKSILFSLRILFIPVVASVSYELLKLSAKYEKNILSKMLVFPGMIFQLITTKKPDNSQIEVAIYSLNQVLNKEGKN